MKLNVNGRELTVPDRLRDETLAHVLREHLGLVGTKLSCGIGECGSCTVLVDGEPLRSCLVTADSVEGAELVTIEGLAEHAGVLHPLQQVWIDEHVAQCGYCQAGQIMRAVALLAATPTPDENDIVDAMSDNLCRCGTYARIKRAIVRAAAATTGVEE